MSRYVYAKMVVMSATIIAMLRAALCDARRLRVVTSVASASWRCAPMLLLTRDARSGRPRAAGAEL